ncbi:hypothetical protein HKW75_29955 [Pseudomonas aeruginosa]|nr:hypothetical protein [Pseudomonas aeruginosa]
MDDAFSEEGSAQPRHDAQRPALAPRSDGFDIHTYHPDFVADPYPLLRLVRSRAPVCRDQASIWWISRYADVCGVVVILAHAKRGSEWLEALGD